MGSLLRVIDLTKIFGSRWREALQLLETGHDKEEVLKRTGATVGVAGASFEVAKGEVFVIMGLSGSGKSTVVRCLNRLIEPTGGKVFVGEQEVTGADEAGLRDIRRRRMAMVFQRFGLFPHLTVAENVAYGLKIQGLKRRDYIERAQEALDKVGLAEWAEAPPDQLSGGMQQRVGIARALVTDPDVLLMDEPFSALDPLIRRDMQDELVRLQSDVQKTIVFITHDLDEALKLGDRIAVMKDGVIHQIGTPEEILREPATEYVATFVEGVNPQHVLRADHIMKRPDALVKTKDGPRVALREMRGEGLSSVFLVDEGGRLVGLVTADAAVAAIKEGRKDLRELAVTDLTRVRPETSLEELIPIGAHTRYPVPVVDERERLVGIIVRASILEGLLENRRTDTEPAERENGSGVNGRDSAGGPDPGLGRER